MTFPKRARLTRRGLMGSAAAAGLFVGLPAIRLSAAGAPLSPTWMQRPLLQPDLTRSLDVRNLSKPVEAKLLLDDMERDSGWEATPAVSLGYASERARSGTRSLRVSVKQRDEAYIRANRQTNGSFTGGATLFETEPAAAVVTRKFDPPQDWSDYNRISLWCYVHSSSHPLTALSLQFTCDGASAGPADPIAVHYIGDLRRGEWNQLVWEIPEHQRNRVSAFTLFQPRWGVSIRGADPIVTYDFDLLELHRVEAEPVQGWAVADGKISYSHVGYLPGSSKIALAPSGAETEFTLIGASGAVAGRFPAEEVSNRRGSWRRLDFSTFARPGVYRLRCGACESEPFPIEANVWSMVVEATLNAYYGLRCGFALPGIHDTCHTDVLVEYNGERRSLGGGWHDAANLTQNAGNTHLSIYALIELADALRDRGSVDLAARAEEEARWGLDWSMRLRFGPGLRCSRDPASYYTDAITGTDDDVVQSGPGAVRKDTFQNILSVMAYARAARALKPRNAALSRQLLAAAEEDFAVTLPDIKPTVGEPANMNQAAWRDQVGYLCTAAVDLFRLTGAGRYRDAAADLARHLVATQERQFVHGIPVAGYFYEDPARSRIGHDFHNSYEECGPLAFEALCETFPDHPDWMSWYAGLLIYSEYFCTKGAEASGPFDILAAAVWRRSDLDGPVSVDRMGESLAAKPSGLFPTPSTPAIIRKQMGEMFEAAADLGADHRLRVFPLWPDHIRHGGTVVHMTKVIGLATAARMRRNQAGADLAERQLQWVLGANPFSRSLMYGVGKDWWQNFSVELPNLVGGVSLGMNAYAHDTPAWGNNAVFPYKEMWVFASSRIAMVLSRIGLPARLHVQATENVLLTNTATGAAMHLKAGDSDLHVPAGRYSATFAGQVRPIVLVSGESRRLKFDRASTIEMSLSASMSDDRTVNVVARFSGAGSHHLAHRLYNLRAERAPEEVDLSAGPQEVRWAMAVLDPLSPWAVVFVPDGDMSASAELFGTSRPLSPIA